MPKTDSALRKASTAGSGTGLSTIENKPQAPVKSRFQMSWPGAPGSAG
jgi:hypothetical protein